MALKWLRDQMQYLHWVLWLIVAAFIFALFFDFGSIRELGRADTDVAATVGDEHITYAEFRSTYRNLEDRYRQMFRERWDAEMAQRFGIARQALDQLVNRQILLMEAERVGLRVTDDEVQRAILDMPAFQDENGKFLGLDRVRRVLRSLRMTEEEFAAAMREDVLIDKLNQVLASTAYVSDQEIERAWREQNESAEIRFVELRAADLGEVQASDDEVAAHFEAQKTDYQLPEQRVADVLLVDRTLLRDQIDVAEEELRSYYENNQDDFEREEQVRARHILLRTGPERDLAAATELAGELKRRAEAGEDFGDLAREYSDDTSNAERGGDLGFFGRGAMVEPFEEAAFGAEPGSVVGPVETDFGVHVIEVQARRPGGVQPFEQVQAVIRARLVNEQVEELAETKAKDLAGRLGQESEVTKDTMQQLADEDPAASLLTTEPFAADESVPRIGRVPAFGEAVFGADEGELTDAVKVPRGWAVARVAEVRAPRLPELDEVRAQVQADATREARKRVAVQRLLDARQRLAEGSATLDDVAAELGMEVKESGEVTRFGQIEGLGQATAVIDAAMQLEEGAVSEPVTTENGAVLFRVTARTSFDPQAFDDAKGDLRQQLLDERVQRLTASIIEERRRDLQPTFDPRIVEDFEIGTQAG